MMNDGWVYGLSGMPVSAAGDLTMPNQLTAEMGAGCHGCHANATNDFVFVPLADGTTDGGTTDGGTTDGGTTDGGATDGGTTDGGTTDGGTTDGGTTDGGTTDDDNAGNGDGA